MRRIIWLMAFVIGGCCIAPIPCHVSLYGDETVKGGSLGIYRSDKTVDGKEFSEDEPLEPAQCLPPIGRADSDPDTATVNDSDPEVAPLTHDSVPDPTLANPDMQELQSQLRALTTRIRILESGLKDLGDRFDGVGVASQTTELGTVASSPKKSSPKSRVSQGYPIRESWWTGCGSWSHMTRGEHKGKYDPAWLKSLSWDELQSLHSDDHEGRVKTAYVVRPASKVAQSKPATRKANPIILHGCPNGQCPLR